MDHLRRHFHTFDALRFLAFLKVFLVHLPVVSFAGFGLLTHGGGIGVRFFFVLSGFLITYIILEERQRTGHLPLTNFFGRRVLRIWPLYYLMLLLGFLTPRLLVLFSVSESSEGYAPNWWCSILFLENYMIIGHESFPQISMLGVMWSLCVEEHFYLLWGLALYWIPLHRTPLLILVAIGIAYLSRYVFYVIGLDFMDLLTNFDYFAFGAIPAFGWVTQGAKLEPYVNRIPHYIKICLVAIILCYVLFISRISYAGQELVEPLILCILFSSLVFMVLPENSTLKISDSHLLSKLGRYTYSLYLSHSVVINLVDKLRVKLQLSLSHWGHALVFIMMCLTISILVSMISYHTIEKPFLKLKKYF